MSELDELLGETDSDTDLVRTLRKALKDRDKEFKALQDDLAKRAAADRQRDLAGVLTQKGLPEKVAKLYPKDAEPTAEAVDAWLVDYADVFGIEQQGAADAATVNSAQRIAQASAGAPPAAAATDIQALAAEIAAAKTPEAYQAALAKLNMK